MTVLGRLRVWVQDRRCNHDWDYSHCGEIRQVPM